jgi:hypothetical protein
MMDCLHAMAPNDGDLLRYILDGEPLPAETNTHVYQCSTCRQRLVLYSSTNTFLLMQIYRCQCPSPTQLSYYCSNLLSEDDAIYITHHLEMCPLCTAEVRETRSILAHTEDFLDDNYKLA